MSNLFSDELIQRLINARHVGVLTGAGVSAESGVATFREAEGLWSRFKPEELANVHAFLNNPVLVQQWYRERRRIAQEALPNQGHLALSRLEQECERSYKEFTLITQNVDNLHQRAGSKNLVELHGNISRSYCMECKKEANEAEIYAADPGTPVRCGSCEGLVRPDVVWFGEMLPSNAIEYAFAAAQRASVFLSVGTSAVVYPAADIPVLAKDYGAYVVEINVEPSAISSMLDETVIGPAGEVLPALVETVCSARAPHPYS